MPLIYVTGVSGSGKSAVHSRLQKLGYVAYDVDDHALSGVFENKSNKRVAMPPAEQRTPEWFATHSWLMIPAAIQRVKAESEQQLVFLCGAARNDKDFWKLFDIIIFLDITEATLRRRVAGRHDNDYGKNEHELQDILAWHKKAANTYRMAGARIIDANLPLDDVIEKIFQIATHSRPLFQ